MTGECSICGKVQEWTVADSITAYLEPERKLAGGIVTAGELMDILWQRAEPQMEVLVDGLPLRHLVVIDGKVYLSFRERKGNEK